MTSIDIYGILSSKPHNSHYLNRYWKFIQYCRNTKFYGYTEQHHICPKSSDLFPEYESFEDNDWNKILLSDRAHFIAHWLLWKSYGGKQTFPFMQMCNNANPSQMGRQSKNINSKTYSILKENARRVIGDHSKGMACYRDINGTLIRCSTTDPRVLSGELISTTKGRKHRPKTEECKRHLAELGKIRRFNPNKEVSLYFLEYKILVKFHSINYVLLLEQGWTRTRTKEHKSETTRQINFNRSKESYKRAGKTLSNTLKSQ